MEFQGTEDIYRGFTRHSFLLDGVQCYIVEPKEAAPGRPWLWRARFWDAWPAVDLAMLELGYHLVHIDVGNLYGSDEALARWDKFYNLLTGEYGFAKKTVLEGFSRGGLIIFNWAERNPEKVACIYADNPVCDFKSWPFGCGDGPGSAVDTENCLKAYGMTMEEALEYKLNPLDNLAPLAAAKIPLIHVCGDADEVVPYPENTAIVEKRYRELGGEIKVIIKPGFKHHPHCLENPAPVVDFILANNQI